MSESEARRSYPEFPDVAGFVEVLNRRGVRFVVIGGSAVQFWVPEMITHDVDFSPATDRANLERLSAALYELAARIRTDAVPEGLAFHHDAASFIGAKMFNLQCPKGAFDLAFEPAGGGYDHLAPRARVLKLRGVDIPVADLATWWHPRSWPTVPRTWRGFPTFEQSWPIGAAWARGRQSLERSPSPWSRLSDGSDRPPAEVNPCSVSAMADTAMKPSRPQTTSWLIMTCAVADLRTVLANPLLIPC